MATRQEVATIMGILSENYPTWKPSDLTLDVWHEMLADMAYPALLVSARMHMAESAYPPTIADIRHAGGNTPMASRAAEGVWRLMEASLPGRPGREEKASVASSDPAAFAAVEDMDGWNTLWAVQDAYGGMNAEAKAKAKQRFIAAFRRNYRAIQKQALLSKVAEKRNPLLDGGAGTTGGPVPLDFNLPPKP